MKELAEIQKKHFDKMSIEELREALQDTEKELGLLFGPSPAATYRREELEARIAYIEECMIEHVKENL